MLMFLVDSHCHLHLLDLSQAYNQADQVIQRAHEANVHYLLNVSVNKKDFPALIQLAEKYKEVAISAGLHPNARDEEIDEAELMRLAQHNKVIAIGETGLDYFRSEGNLDWQRMRFRSHIRAAKALRKPLIVHTRDAISDTFSIMKEENANEVGGVMHCFTENKEAAQQALDLGFFISFSGIVTFKNALHIQETAKYVPMDRLLLETDSPYLAPAPHRGKPNEPAYTYHTAAYLAALRDTSLENLAEATTHNFFTLFKGAIRPHV
jgi:TatD DNase family protein